MGSEGGRKAVHKLVGEFGGRLRNCADSANCVVTLVILGSAISTRISFKHIFVVTPCMLSSYSIIIL